MNRFEENISPLSQLFVFLGFMPMFIILFRPSIVEFLVFFVVDYAALFIMMALDKWLFLKFYPDCVPFFLGVDFPAIERCTPAQQAALYRAMVRYPERRGLYVLATNIVKTLPGTLVVVFYWKHDTSNWIQFAKCMTAGLVIISYYYAALFIESHGLISEKIAEIHARYDWTEVFKKISLTFQKREFEVEEVIALASIWFFTIVLQWLVITTNTSSDVRRVALEIVTVAFGGLVLISRIWYLGRKYVTSGLEDIFKVVDTFELENFPKTLPLHSITLVSYFEKTFNALMERLRSYKLELSHWVSVQAEESRYRALGEISALIVHDLSAPLHVINFCTERLRENPELLKDSRYLQELTVNGSRSVELIDSLRSYLKGSPSQDESVSFAEVHKRVLRLLETQFYSEGFKKFTFAADARVMSLRLKISKADFTHILLNLLKNSVENQIYAKTPEPRVDIKLVDYNGTAVVIELSDKGTGLTPERFEELTAITLLPSHRGGREGLGLRLIRRLVERYGGNLSVVRPLQDQSGTTFHLTLRILEQPKGET